MPKTPLLPYLAAVLSLACTVVHALPVETVGSHRGTPWRVVVAPTGTGAVVTGEVLGAIMNPGRRPGGEVRVEVVDAAGAVLVVHRAELQRLTPARHTRRGRFRLDLTELPAAAAWLRVSY